MQSRSGHVFPALGLLLAFWYPAPLAAKGLGELAPKTATPQPASPTPTKEATPGQEVTAPAGKEAAAEEAPKPVQVVAPSELSLALKDRLVVSTSMGFAYVQQGSASWLGSGMSDLAAAFRLQQTYADGSLFATLRYAPLDVAPRIDDDPAEAFIGVLEAYLVGGRWQRPLRPDWQLQLGLEVGLLHLSVEDQLGVDYEKAPSAYGFTLALAAGAAWQLNPHVTLGPQLHLSLGSYTILQLGAHAAFAF